MRPATRTRSRSAASSSRVWAARAAWKGSISTWRPSPSWSTSPDDTGRVKRGDGRGRAPQPSPVRRDLGAGGEPPADKRGADEGRRDEQQRCRLGRWRARGHTQVVQVKRFRHAAVVAGADSERIERCIRRPAEERVDRTDLPDELRNSTRHIEGDAEGLTLIRG